ncbi:hypothetical protein IFM89_019572 [Coptis chinensis]|uniref:Uncharacterized protein n=1 Tax=Coptis chinensis TaxID=261450 RepID=A0A835HG79_9MAGN|nr:hypothetical protein IFM89_019572 [Coptis chinensis]
MIIVDPKWLGDDDVKALNLQSDFTRSREPSFGVSNGFILKKGDADNLLDAMVSYMCDASGDIASLDPIVSDHLQAPHDRLIRFLPNAAESIGCDRLGENDSVHGAQEELVLFPHWERSYKVSI